MKIKVGARSSQLSRRQVEEVMGNLGVEYECEWVETVGDRDLKSSLGPMDKTDFFTRDIDERVLEGKCDVGIHSAKDLPEPLPEGLSVVALTEGIDSSDSLVMRKGERFENLKAGAVIGSSSPRRDRIVKSLKPDLKCVEMRGPVEMRLDKLDRGGVDGLVVAEAALIRLGLTARNRIALPGKTAHLQGKLAVVARKGNEEVAKLFKGLDCRKKKRVLYLGTEPSALSTKFFGYLTHLSQSCCVLDLDNFKKLPSISALCKPKKSGHKFPKEFCRQSTEGEVVHLPLIEIVPRDFQSFDIRNAFADIREYTHVIFTSKNGARVFFDCLEFYGHDLGEKKIFAVGKMTAGYLEERGVKVDQVAVEETQEGVIHLLAMEDLDDAYVLLPQSSRARPALVHSLMMRRVRHQRVYLYDTKVKFPSVKPDLESFDEIIFTSPSTVEAFSKVFGRVPKEVKITPIGPITQRAIKLNLYDCR